MQTELLYPSAAKLVAVRKEPLVHAQAATGVDVELGHPGADAVGMELVVPRTVERVGEVDPAAVAAHRDHLRPAAKRQVRSRGVRGTTQYAAESHRVDLPRPSGIGNV